MGILPQQQQEKSDLSPVDQVQCKDLSWILIWEHLKNYFSDTGTFVKVVWIWWYWGIIGNYLEGGSRAFRDTAWIFYYEIIYEICFKIIQWEVGERNGKS